MSVVVGLRAALLLARGRPEGLGYLDPSVEGAARSFVAALICLPPFVALRVLDWSAIGAPANFTHAALLELLTYAIGWVGYAIASRAVLGAIGLLPRWPLFISAWNWCNVAQYILLLAAQLPILLGAPAWLSQIAWIVAVCWAIWLQWFATRLTLAIGKLPAAGFVALDVAIGLLLAAVTGV